MSEPYIPHIWKAAADKSWNIHMQNVGRPLPETGEALTGILLLEERAMPELLSIRLPDGTIRELTTAELVAYQGDWQVNLAHLTEHELEQGIARLKRCLAHEDGVRCPVCSGDDYEQ